MTRLVIDESGIILKMEKKVCDLTEDEMTMLKEVYDYNPIKKVFIVKTKNGSVLEKSYTDYIDITIVTNKRKVELL